MKSSLLPSALLFALAPTFSLANTALVASTTAPAPVSTAAVSPPDASEVVWTTPSKNTYETMPLGNGEVALNAWVDELGDLRFYIARIDSVDEHARLLKLGAVRVRVGDASAKRTAAAFRQKLDIPHGVLTAEYGTGAERVSLRLWVDAHRPVIIVEAETAAPVAASAHSELWRDKREKIDYLQCSDIYNNSPYSPYKKGSVPGTFSEPDVVLENLSAGEIGWFHRNTYSDPYKTSAALQGLDDFPRQDPILHRTFGVVVRAKNAVRADNKTLQAPASTIHRFEIVAHTKHPAAVADWLAETTRILDDAQKIPLATRREKHEQWWHDYATRSWVRISTSKAEKSVANNTAIGNNADPVPANKHDIIIGHDQRGGSRFQGTIGRVSAYKGVLSVSEIKTFSELSPGIATTYVDEKSPLAAKEIFNAPPNTQFPRLAGTAKKTFGGGFTIEAYIEPKKISDFSRIVDKITPGGSDGFLLDATPGNGLRFILGETTLTVPNILITKEWNHVAATVSPEGEVRLYVGAKLVSANINQKNAPVAGDDAFALSHAYALQRYVSACAGRGRYPIKYNGSLFTVPETGKKEDADYRRWGPGYWWQNTRLPYLSMPAAGDFDFMHSLFRTYIDDLLPLCKYRTKKYLGHGGAFYPECIYFWGDVFPETYGWKPYAERADKLQVSGYHKWEWVGGLEIAQMAFEYAEYTGDNVFLRDKAIPFATEILRFFNEHYQTDADGKLHMWPAQALETWWDCVNPMPEVAGLHAVTAQLEAATAAAPLLRPAFLTALKNKLPPLPLTKSRDGKPMFAPAKISKQLRNVENPELYAVFPFRLATYATGDSAAAIEALKHRRSRGAFGWRQDDLFMTNLGLGDQARDFLVKRARNKHKASRFPAFWGPNYDWTPDQDHGGVLAKGVQSLVLQCDGRRIDLFPAWSAGWDCDFKLHAPYQTTIEATLKNGKITKLIVTPKSREKDVRILLKK
ncbi:MAG: DUF5703 domain-containing protein [Puniceicoccales bacterium]|nr:DUF5703 domain-containing protein [Puniceicoccales bacterium]